MRDLLLTLYDVVEGVRVRPARFGLSFLAITVGIVAFALLVAVLFALKERSDRLVQELGVDVVALLPADGRGRLAATHAALLARNFPSLSVTTIKRYRVPTLGTRQQLTVIATDERLAAVRRWPLVSGRFLDSRDLTAQSRHAVVSRALSEAWNWNVGNIIYVRETPFTIVGIVDVGGSGVDEEYGDPRLGLGDRIVMVPNSVAPYWQVAPNPPAAGIDAAFVTGPARWSRTLLPAIQGVLNQPDLEVGNLSWITPESLLRDLNRLTRTIAISVGAIALLCLLLGGTTLVSLMVTNVRDRVTEIGLRRALGATRWDIGELFIVEAVMVTLLAGAAGTLLSHLILIGAAPSLPIPVQVGWMTMVLPPAVAVVLGVAFAYWPAHTAARIVPSEALRNE